MEKEKVRNSFWQYLGKGGQRTFPLNHRCFISAIVLCLPFIRLLVLQHDIKQQDITPPSHQSPGKAKERGTIHPARAGSTIPRKVAEVTVKVKARAAIIHQSHQVRAKDTITNTQSKPSLPEARSTTRLRSRTILQKPSRREAKSAIRLQSRTILRVLPLSRASTRLQSRTTPRRHLVHPMIRESAHLQSRTTHRVHPLIRASTRLRSRTTHRVRPMIRESTHLRSHTTRLVHLMIRASTRLRSRTIHRVRPMNRVRGRGKAKEKVEAARAQSRRWARAKAGARARRKEKVTTITLPSRRWAKEKAGARARRKEKVTTTTRKAALPNRKWAKAKEGARAPRKVKGTTIAKKIIITTTRVKAATKTASAFGRQTNDGILEKVERPSFLLGCSTNALYMFFTHVAVFSTVASLLVSKSKFVRR